MANDGKDQLTTGTFIDDDFSESPTNPGIKPRLTELIKLFRREVSEGKEKDFVFPRITPLSTYRYGHHVVVGYAALTEDSLTIAEVYKPNASELLDAIHPDPLSVHEAQLPPQPRLERGANGTTVAVYDYRNPPQIVGDGESADDEGIVGGQGNETPSSQNVPLPPLPSLESFLPPLPQEHAQCGQDTEFGKRHAEGLPKPKRKTGVGILAAGILATLAAGTLVASAAYTAQEASVISDAQGVSVSPAAQVSAANTEVYTATAQESRQEYKPLTVSGATLTLHPDADLRLTGQGISSYIITAHRHGLEAIASMSADRLATEIDHASLRDLSPAQRKTALADIRSCIEADESGAKILREHNPQKLADGKANILDKHTAEFQCAVSLPAGEKTSTAAAPHSKGTIDTAVQDYTNGSAVDFREFSLQERLASAVELYKITADKTAETYKTTAQLAKELGISAKKLAAEAKKAYNGFSRRAYAVQQKTARVEEAARLYETHSKTELATFIAEKYQVSRATAYRDIARANQKLAEHSSVFAVPEPVAYMRLLTQKTQTVCSGNKAEEITTMPCLHPYEAAEPVTLLRMRR